MKSSQMVFIIVQQRNVYSRSTGGFKEIEYEVMRDKNDNAIVVCNMENIDTDWYSYWRFNCCGS